MLLQVSRDWLTAPEPPAGLAAHQELFGYVWLALACDVASAGSIRPENARAGLGAMRDCRCWCSSSRRHATAETRQHWATSWRVSRDFRR